MSDEFDDETRLGSIGHTPRIPGHPEVPQPFLSQTGQQHYHSMLVPCHDTKPSFMIFMRVSNLQELKNQVSQSFRPSHDAQIFEFHSHFLRGT